ncbi:ATP-dependent zinc protease family protein [Mangrovimonas aestuarii]|uniref:ATP-dependent zinc protease family protein n=1 Tax=Mangrovimonas aestuarii TaxID=3018443 RepID=UPI00237834A7|nr:RimK/LysX family protein [Mangrovimonas aestuarii]
MTKKTIGRIDRVDFPMLNLNDIDVKIDTGAYTSSIHCSKVIEKDNTLICSFESEGHPNFKTDDFIFTEYSKTVVKSSNGQIEDRFKIKSEVIFFGKTYKINLTLSTRDDMKFPVLIGRRFLKSKFLVDVDLENVSYNSKQS